MTDLIKEVNDAFECVGILSSILDHVDLGSTGAGIDLAAHLRLHVKAIEKVEKALTKINAATVRMDTPTPQGISGRLEGIRFYATVTQSIVWSIDGKAVRDEMGDKWYDARCKQSERVTVKYMEGE